MERRLLISLSFIVASFGLLGYAIWHTNAFRTIRELQPTESGKTGPTLRFIAVGDNHGDNPIYDQILQEVKNGPYAFLLNVADETNDGTTEEFQVVKQLHTTLPFPVEYTVGSHDFRADPTRKLFVDAFGQQPCRSADYQQLHLIVLDNGDRKVGFSDNCLEWLKNDLAAHTTQPIIIAYHRPFDLPLSAITGDDETPASRLTDAKFLDIIRPAKNIQLIINAHLHTFLPYTLNDIPAVVTGGGGEQAQQILGGSKANYFHYLVVTVTGSSVSYVVHRVQLTS